MFFLLIAPEGSSKQPASEPTTEPETGKTNENKWKVLFKMNNKLDQFHIEPTTEPATEPPSSTTAAPARPQPFRPRLFNKTKRLVLPHRERPNLQASLSKRQIRTKRAVPGAEPSSEPEPETKSEPGE